MKRTICMTLALSLLLGQTVFAGFNDIPMQAEGWPPTSKLYQEWGIPTTRWQLEEEKQIRLLKNGREISLRYPLCRYEDTLMISAEDFAAAFDGKILFPSDAYENGTNKFILARGNGEDADGDRWLGGRWETLNMTYASWDEPLGRARYSTTGVRYVPLRELLEKWYYDVTWKREQGETVLLVQAPTIPDFTMTASYDIDENIVLTTLTNPEPEDYLLGYEFILEKWDGAQWKKAPMNAEVCYAAGGYDLPGGGKTTTVKQSLWFYSIGGGMEPGQYRIKQEIWEKDKPVTLTSVISAKFEVPEQSLLALFGTENQLYLKGHKQALQYPLAQITGTTMISLEDLETISDGAFSEKHFQYMWAVDDNKLMIMGKGEAIYGRRLDGVWYVPLRQAMDRISWQTEWRNTAEGKGIWLESPAT